MNSRSIRKLISFTLVLSMIGITACSSSKPSDSVSSSAATQPGSDAPASSASASSEQSPAADPLGKYDPPITVTAVRADPGTTYKFDENETLENNVWTQAYEDDLGIKLKYNWVVPSDQYPQKLSVSIASGDLPDILSVDAKNLKLLIDNDMVADLTDVYDQYATPLTKSIIEGDGGRMLGTAKFGDKLMAIPATGSILDSIDLIWIRNDWLEKLNLPIPKTMDELVKTAEAFVTQDPDGNNEADTFGLVINKNAVSGTLTGFGDIAPIFYGYKAYPNGWLKDASGSLVYGTIQPEVKTALAALQDMYKKKLIDPEFGVKDDTKAAETTTAGKAGIVYGAMWNSLWPLNASKENPDDQADWIPIAPVSADDNPVLSLVTASVGQYHVVNKNAKHPEAIMKLINERTEKFWGPNAEPAKYNTTPEGKEVFKMAVLGLEPPKKNIEQYRAVTAAVESNDPSSLTAEHKGTYDKVVAYRDGDIKSWGIAAVFGPDGSQSILDQIDKNQQYLFTEFYGTPTQTMAEKGATLDKIRDETFLKIIMNKAPIEEFDQFVEKWKSLGGDDITKEVNDWYNSK